jgi:hypothetical protein
METQASQGKVPGSLEWARLKLLAMKFLLMKMKLMDLNISPEQSWIVKTAVSTFSTALTSAQPAWGRTEILDLGKLCPLVGQTFEPEITARFKGEPEARPVAIYGLEGELSKIDFSGLSNLHWFIRRLRQARASSLVVFSGPD